MEKEIKFKQPDYRKIREIGRRIDCTITKADFNTNYPNSCRIDRMVSDIHRYLKRGGKL